MLNSLILLTYHAISGLRRKEINFVASVSWTSCWCLAVCNRTLLTRPSTSGETDSTCASRWKTFWTLVASFLSDWKIHGQTKCHLLTSSYISHKMFLYRWVCNFQAPERVRWEIKPPFKSMAYLLRRRSRIFVYPKPNIVVQKRKDLIHAQIAP